MKTKPKYIKMVLEYLTNGTCRVWWWNHRDGLVKSQRKATHFATPQDCHNAIDTSFWQDDQYYEIYIIEIFA